MAYCTRFSISCLSVNTWSIVDFPGLKPHWYSPTISFVYGLSLFKITFDNIL
jgi:hypothetical protein